MTLLHLSPQALAHSRFALSPLAETLGSIMVLGRGSTDPRLVDWQIRHRPVFNRELAANPFAAGLVTLLVSSKWLPDFVVLPPRGGMSTAIADELKRMTAISDLDYRSTVDDSLRHSWKTQDLSWLSGRGLSAQTAAFFRFVWQHCVLPEWPQRRMQLEREVMYRAGLLAAYGWPRTLDKMSKRSAWVGADAIRFSHQPFADLTVSDKGMLFVPISLNSGTWLCEAPPDEFALVYPARGATTEEPEVDGSALDRLIGPGRAKILRELARPATSTELTVALDFSLGTVGGHLAVLRESGLVVGARVGRKVIYRRTEMGENLLSGSIS